MVKHHKDFLGGKATQSIIMATIVLLVLLVGAFFYQYFFMSKGSRYLLENKYYGFELNTPKGWTAEGKTAVYSEESIAQILSECKNNKSDGSPTYEIGRFRFTDQKYPQGFGDTGYFPAGFLSGAILDVTINCIPDDMKDQLVDYKYGNLEIGGAKAFGAFVDLLGIGRARYLSFLHNNLQYRISEFTYVSSDDGAGEVKLRQNYTGIFNKILSSFKFIK